MTSAHFGPEQFARAFAPLAGLAALAFTGLAMKNGAEGVPLDELDLSGEPPRHVALAGPDQLLIRVGEVFAISVDGDDQAATALRFSLRNCTLSIARGTSGGESGVPVTITVTMPAPRKLSLAGSGSIECETLTGAAKVSIGGSGWIATPAVDAVNLKVSISGSGSYIAAGRAGHLELAIGGSGSARMDELSV